MAPAVLSVRTPLISPAHPCGCPCLGENSRDSGLLPSGISPIQRVVSSSSSLVFVILNEFHRWLSMRRTYFIAGWAYAEMFKGRKSRVTGPSDHKDSVSAKSILRQSSLCTFNLTAIFRYLIYVNTRPRLSYITYECSKYITRKSALPCPAVHACLYRHNAITVHHSIAS